MDARGFDARALDARALDARALDARALDARALDACFPDAQHLDAAAVDAELPDASLLDSGSNDGQVPPADAATGPDSGTDAGIVTCSTSLNPAECVAVGGEYYWDPWWPAIEYCACPTSDGGTPCYGYDGECEYLCLLPAGAYSCTCPGGGPCGFCTYTVYPAICYCSWYNGQEHTWCVN